MAKTYTGKCNQGHYCKTKTHGKGKTCDLKPNPAQRKLLKQYRTAKAALRKLDQKLIGSATNSMHNIFDEEDYGKPSYTNWATLPKEMRTSKADHHDFIVGYAKAIIWGKLTEAQR